MVPTLRKMVIETSTNAMMAYLKSQKRPRFLAPLIELGILRSGTTFPEADSLDESIAGVWSDSDFREICSDDVPLAVIAAEATRTADSLAHGIRSYTGRDPDAGIIERLIEHGNGMSATARAWRALSSELNNAPRRAAYVASQGWQIMQDAPQSNDAEKLKEFFNQIVNGTFIAGIVPYVAWSALSPREREAQFSDAAFAGLLLEPLKASCKNTQRYLTDRAITSPTLRAIVKYADKRYLETDLKTKDIGIRLYHTAKQEFNGA